MVGVGCQRIQEVVSSAKITELPFGPAEGLRYGVPGVGRQVVGPERTANKPHSAPAVAHCKSTPTRLTREHRGTRWKWGFPWARIRQEYHFLGSKVVRQPRMELPQWLG